MGEELPVITACERGRQYLSLSVERANGLISFWALGLCFLVYVSLYYVSPNADLQLLNSTKFWFFISNTLIFIIAADSGALSSSSSSTRDRSIIVPQQDHHHHNSQLLDPHKQMVTVDHETKIIAPTLGSQLPVVIHEPTDASSIVLRDNQLLLKNSGSSSDHQMHPDDNNNNNNALVELQNHEIHDEEAQHHEPFIFQEDRQEGGDDDKEEDLSRLSDEDLNRRVEEFIQNFNRQIRLQAAPPNLCH